ncbi:ArsC/Spx/MgsR family protein [Columbia Basin potato purple top phytoplasma]|uniref:Spx/MgsR family RNA polymerase-binding regulatory protein n=1 Tax=Columbia Basin potato purple top phytoplasma TaxID=307134 RepID=A0ABT5LBW3_9MOLU|nr:ArsC/Spx/MgsR family protein [Columbia Basin potato purple top phytoplasma]MDC9032132.1 Spx/MgsR family RNA polymerase-binding regulatory protein [Columbia Basin potato purple top phytoplasma]
MVFILTSNRCSSCKKAKQWLDLHHIKYHEKNLSHSSFTEKDIDIILNYENIDFTNIISTRSRIFKKQKKDLFLMTIQKIKKFIVKNPSICKKPIIYNSKSIVIGYNKEDIRVFMPKNLRKYIIQNNINTEYNNNYVFMIKKYFSFK